MQGEYDEVHLIRLWSGSEKRVARAREALLEIIRGELKKLGLEIEQEAMTVAHLEACSLLPFRGGSLFARTKRDFRFFDHCLRVLAGWSGNGQVTVNEAKRMLLLAYEYFRKVYELDSVQVLLVVRRNFVDLVQTYRELSDDLSHLSRHCKELGGGYEFRWLDEYGSEDVYQLLGVEASDLASMRRFANEVPKFAESFTEHWVEEEANRKCLTELLRIIRQI